MRFLGMLVAPDAPDGDAALATHIERTLLDPVSLALGARGDYAHVARERGLAAARLHDILVLIGRGFPIQAFRQRTWHAGSGRLPLEQVARREAALF